MARPTTKNTALSALVQDAARREGLKQRDLIQATGFGKGPIGAVWRGEVARVHPEVANSVCRELGIPLRRFLRTAGYDISDSVPSLPKELESLVLEDWPRLTPQQRAYVLGIAHEFARGQKPPGETS